ncbi:MAG TPA: hypothetical protein VMT24_04955, partial [Aggregatilineaceae bacterium]|nr:hypothetical protein [Aggregatilineaceae bacterium]
MIQPFTELDLTIQFYPVADDLSTKPNQILERVDEHTLAVMLLRYFGFDAPIDIPLPLQANMPDLPIIDDRTHHLLSDLKSGRALPAGVIAIYSVRKWAPVPDLGLVCWPRSAGPS